MYCLSRSTLPVKPASTRKLPLWGVIQSLSNALDILNRKLKNIIKILKKCHWMRWKDCGRRRNRLRDRTCRFLQNAAKAWLDHLSASPQTCARTRCQSSGVVVIRKGSFRSALKGAASGTIAAWAPASRHSRSTGAWSQGVQLP